MEHTNSEALVNLFYHDGAKEWEALVLPQEGYTGMTVKSLPDHPGRSEAIATLPRLPGGTWEPHGTVHHHCRASAFQSGTDSADEAHKEGLHITIGNLGDKQYSIHARTSFRGVMSEASLIEWFDFDATGLPASVWNTVLAHRLTTPTGISFATPTDGSTSCWSDIDLFPAWWRNNVIKVERPVSAVTRWGDAWQPMRDSHKPTQHTQPPYRTIFEREADLREALLEAGLMFGMTSPAHLAEWLKELAEFGEVLDVLVEHGFEIRDAIEILENSTTPLSLESASPSNQGLHSMSDEEAWQHEVGTIGHDPEWRPY